MLGFNGGRRVVCGHLDATRTQPVRRFNAGSERSRPSVQPSHPIKSWSSMSGPAWMRHGKRRVRWKAQEIQVGGLDVPGRSGAGVAAVWTPAKLPRLSPACGTLFTTHRAQFLASGYIYLFFIFMTLYWQKISSFLCKIFKPWTKKIMNLWNF